MSKYSPGVSAFSNHIYCTQKTFFLSLSFHTNTSHSSLRQYPLYSKNAPPTVLAQHFSDDLFEKSQLYGKDKAKFSLFSGLYRQIIDSVMLQFGIYAWAWGVGGNVIEKLGYSTEYEVGYLWNSLRYPCAHVRFGRLLIR